MKKFLSKIILSLSFIFPSVAIAQTLAPRSFKQLVVQFIEIANNIVVVLIAFGVVLFIIGILRYVASGENKEKVEEGKRFAIWGIIAIFVMVSVWGLVNVLLNTFDLDSSLPPNPRDPPQSLFHEFGTGGGGDCFNPRPGGPELICP